MEESGLSISSKLNPDTSSKLSDDETASSTSTPLANPPALDETVATYALVCVRTYIRRTGPSRTENLISHERTGEMDKLRDILIFEQDTAVLPAKHNVFVGDSLILNSTGEPLCNEAPGGNGSYSRPSISRPPATIFSSPTSGSTRLAPYIPSALTVRLSSTKDFTEILAYLAHLYAYTNILSSYIHY